MYEFKNYICTLNNLRVLIVRDNIVLQFSWTLIFQRLFDNITVTLVNFDCCWPTEINHR